MRLTRSASFFLFDIQLFLILLLFKTEITETDKLPLHEDLRWYGELLKRQEIKTKTDASEEERQEWSVWGLEHVNLFKQ